MQTNHSAAPWVVSDNNTSVNDANGLTVADLENREHKFGNAHLIAAAPELLAALNGILDVFGFRNDDRWEDTPAIRAALDAIAKATGDN